jgi:hypothetical protein
MAPKDERRLMRTAKPCGPDAPTLVSSLAEVSARRRWQTSPVTEESAEETVKTIARGMPGDSGVTVVTNSRDFFYTRGRGRIERPAFPAPSWGSTAPLYDEGGTFKQNSGASRGEIAESYVIIICRALLETWISKPRGPGHR